MHPAFDEERAQLAVVVLTNLDGLLGHSANQRLEAELHKLAETLYKAEAASEGSPAEPSSEAGAEEDVIDAEYTEEKENS